LLRLGGRDVGDETLGVEPISALPAESLFFQVWIPEGSARRYAAFVSRSLQIVLMQAQVVEARNR